MCYFCFMFASLTLCRLRRGCVASRGCVRSAHVVSASPRLCRFAHVVSASPRLCGFAGFTARSAITARLRAITHACVLYFANGDITARSATTSPTATSPTLCVHQSYAPPAGVGCKGGEKSKKIYFAHARAWTHTYHPSEKGHPTIGLPGHAFRSRSLQRD